MRKVNVHGVKAMEALIPSGSTNLDLFEGVQSWLQIPCEKEDLSAIYRIPHTAFEVGTCLQLDYTDIYSTDRNFREHYEKILYLLHTWRNRNGPNATWWNLILCLEKLGDRRLLEDLRTTIQQKYATAFCRGLDYYAADMADLYRQQQEEQQVRGPRDSGIIRDLNFDCDSEQIEHFETCSPPPSGYNSLTTSDGCRSLSPTPQLTSLMIAHTSVQEPNCGSDVATGYPSLGAYPESPQTLLSASSQYLQPPKSTTSSGSYSSGKTAYYTPPLSYEDGKDGISHKGGPENVFLDSSMSGQAAQPSESASIATNLVGTHTHHPQTDSGEYTQLKKELELKNHELRHIKELHHKEKAKVDALKKILVKTRSCAFEGKMKKEKLESKLQEHEEKLGILLHHLQQCDERQERLRVELETRRERDTLDISVQATLIVLEQENSALAEEVIRLRTKYMQAQMNIQSLQHEYLSVCRQKDQEMAKNRMSEEERKQLESQLSELTIARHELLAQKIRLNEECAALTSPTCIRCPLASPKFPVLLRAKRSRDSAVAQRRCRSDPTCDTEDFTYVSSPI